MLFTHGFSEAWRSRSMEAMIIKDSLGLPQTAKTTGDVFEQPVIFFLNLHERENE